MIRRFVDNTVRLANHLLGTISPIDYRDRVVILMNKNVKMTPGKYASQAVHAALMSYGIDHGSVIVLNATPTQLRAQAEPHSLVHDAGYTEIPAGTLTAGVRREQQNPAQP